MSLLGASSAVRSSASGAGGACGRALARRSVVLLVLATSSACSQASPLEPEALAAAQGRWRAAALSSYRMQLAVSGDRIQEGAFVADVRDGVVVALSRNGAPLATRDSFYTVDGLFRLLGDELGMAKHPDQFWGADPAARVVQRAGFDPERGFVRRYLRAVSGTDQNISLRIDAVEPLP